MKEEFDIKDMEMTIHSQEIDNMKKKLLSACLVLTIVPVVGAISVSAKNKTESQEEILEAEKFSGWNFNKDVNGWQKYNQGILIKNKFIKDSDKVYYALDNGTLASGWQKISNQWYYFSLSNNALLTGWQKVGTRWYYFDADGIMQRDTTVDGYKLGSDGIWVQQI